MKFDRDRTKTKSAHDNYELPSELDFSKLKFAGFGVDSLERHVASKKLRTISLDPDAAKDFPTAKAANEGLRTLCEIRKMMQSLKRRKTA
jgi:hypothetical protein